MTQSAVQKHSGKTLNDDWNALKQKLRLCPPRWRAKFANPNGTEKEVADSSIVPRVSTAIGWQSKWRISPLCERLPSPPHSQDPARWDQCKSYPWCKQLSRPTSRTCRLQKESAWDHLVSCRLGVPSQLALWQLGPQHLWKARVTWSFSLWCLDELPETCLQTRLCWPRALTGEPHRQRWGTHKSSPRRKPTATLTASSSSLRPQDAIGNANSQSSLWRAVTAKKEASWKWLSRQDWTWRGQTRRRGDPRLSVSEEVDQTVCQITGLSIRQVCLYYYCYYYYCSYRGAFLSPRQKMCILLMYFSMSISWWTKRF